MANPPSNLRRPSLKPTLSRRLKGAQRIAILAVGSDLRGDDAGGLLAGRKLKKLAWPRKPAVEIFFGETAPENLSGEIKRFNPTHLVVLDAADRGAKTGSVSLIDLGKAAMDTTFCTHNLPLTVMLRYLSNYIECEILVIGIQAGKLEFGASPSTSILRAADRLARTLHAAILEIGKSGSL